MILLQDSHENVHREPYVHQKSRELRDCNYSAEQKEISLWTFANNFSMSRA